jgi:hypothetical protein
VNNRETLFCRRQATTIFCRVFGEARKRFAFELRGFWLEEEWLSFYIKPADGFQLPAIMQWVKQTFAVWFNLRADRTGHVWGDWYWSRGLEGEPPEWAEEVDWEAVEVAAETGEISFEMCPPDGVSPLVAETPAETGFSPQNPAGASTQSPSARPPNNGPGRDPPNPQPRGAPLVRLAFQKANADAL